MRTTIALVIIGASAHAAAAASITVTAADRGWYSEGGFHDPANDSYFAGDTSRNAQPMGELRNWFIFDLRGLSSQPLVSAFLVLDNRSWFTDTGSETYRVTSTAADRLALQGGTAGTAGFATLGMGTVFGEFTRSGPVVGSVRIELNAEFLAALADSTGGWLVLSGRLTTLTPGGAMFGGSSSAEGGLTPHLLLDDGLPVIPLPNAGGLITAGLMLLVVHRPRRRTEEGPRGRTTT